MGVVGLGGGFWGSRGGCGALGGGLGALGGGLRGWEGVFGALGGVVGSWGGVSGFFLLGWVLQAALLCRTPSPRSFILPFPALRGPKQRAARWSCW